MRSVSWNYLGYFVECGAGLLLTAYVVRRIPVHDFGIYLLAQAIAAFLYLLEFGMGSMLVSLYVSTFARKGIAETGRLTSTVFMALLASGSVGALVLSLAAMCMPELLRLPPEDAALAGRVLILMSMAVALALPQTALELLCQAFHRFDRINQVQIVVVMLRVGLSVAVLMAGKGIVAFATVQVAVWAVRLVGLWIAASASISGLSLRLQFDRGLLLEALHMSKWAFGDDISHRIALNTEPVVLAAFASFEQVALFGVGSRLPAHLYHSAARGLSVLIPTLSQHHAEGDKARLRVTFSSAYRICMTGLAPTAIFGAICAPALVRVWAGPAYANAAPVLAYLLMSALSMVMMLPSDMVLYSHAHIKQAAGFSVLQTFGKVAVASALAGKFGAVGVAAGVTLWHWCVSLFFYFPAACRIAETGPIELWRAALSENRTANVIQGAVFLFFVVALAVGMRVLGSTQMFVVFALISLLYAAIWFYYTALPMWRRSRNESPAAS
jgi:O-antigen/teichoic acid export membrane protein